MLPEKNNDHSCMALPEYRQILIAADASDQSNHAVTCSVAIAELYAAQVTGAHVYAAKLHDIRFRQMEGGLPEAYQQEQELEKQRDIHDELITKGLGVITDSYLDQVDESCCQRNIPYTRRSLEGKNYRELTREANSGKYDLLVMGAQGLGAVSKRDLGTVCDRVTRRCDIDTLIVKGIEADLMEGPIVVAVDGSSRSYGGLMTALSLAKYKQIPVHVVSAYDPYYHYVAFNRIAAVLSEEAGKVFRFKEQEQLHEDIIDAGLAKIYQGHLDVSRDIANEYGLQITTKLLDGKPYHVIAKYVDEIRPSLLIMGKLGIHADDQLDIGGNAENLLRSVDCAVLLSQREHKPSIELLAETTTTWTVQAEQRLLKVPVFARKMARLGILRYTQERGHTVVTESIVDEATTNLCPITKQDADQSSDGSAQNGTLSSQSTQPFHPEWSPEASSIADTIEDETVRNNLKMRAEKKARQAGTMRVSAQHMRSLVGSSGKRDNTDYVVEAGNRPATGKKCPFGFKKETDREEPELPWTPDALERLEKVPAGFMRDLTRQRITSFAVKNAQPLITLQLMHDKYADWQEGSAKQLMQMSWDEVALKKIERIPDFVRGMVVKEVERCAQSIGANQVTKEVMAKASTSWKKNTVFHSETDPEQ